MSNPPYRGLAENELILRDILAVDRTVLANERTLLAYVRTALALVITGVGLIKFFDPIVVQTVGWAFVAAAAIITVIGLKRFRQMQHILRRLRRASHDQARP